MGILRTLFWTGLCVGLGIFVSSYEVDGRTPIEHLQRAWKQNVNPAPLQKLGESAKEKLGEAKQSAKDKLAVATAPKEHISEGDRNALNSLIANKKKAE